MIVSELKLYDFRKFHGNPGLSVTFHKGLNAIIGENDSGETAIIDALKLVLLTQSNEYIRPTEYDFYQSPDGESVSEFRIECTISEFSLNEAKNFIEYDKDSNSYKGSGDITTGAVRLLQYQEIQVTVTGDFEMTSAENAKLPYTMTIGGSAAPVASGDTVATFVTSTEAQRVTLNYSAKNPTYAGNYTDTLTFTIRTVMSN